MIFTKICLKFWLHIHDFWYNKYINEYIKGNYNPNKTKMFFSMANSAGEKARKKWYKLFGNENI